MQVNKFVTMAVGLIVAVLLVSGLMVPVIGSVTGSEDDGGGVGEYRNDVGELNFYFTKLTSDSSYSLTTAYSNSSPQLIINGGEPISPEYAVVIYGGNWETELSLQTRLIDGETIYYGSLKVSNMSHFSYGYFTEAQITGDSIHFYNQYTEQSFDLDGALFLQQSTGEYVMSMNGWYPASQYLSESDFGLYYGFFGLEGMEYRIEGNAISNTVHCSDYFIYHDPQREPFTLPDPARFVIEDDILKEIIITYNGTEYHAVNPEVNTTESDSNIEYMIVPTEVRIGGEGSGLSPTLATLLSVIPLITVVGIIIGTIGYLRFKE